MVGQMDVPGRWAGGFRAWDERGRLPGDRPRRGAGPDAPGAAPRRCGTAVEEWFPFGVHLIAGRVPHGPVDRVDRAPARVAGHPRHAGGRSGPRAEQPGRGRDPRRWTPWAQTLDALLDVARASWPRATITAAQFAGPGRACAARSSAAGRRYADALADARGRAGAWLERPRASTTLDAGPDARRRGRRPGLVRPDAAAVLPGAAPGPPALRVGGQHALGRRSCWPRCASRPAGSPSWSTAVRSYSQMDRASLQRVDVTEGLESTLVMLGHKLEQGVEVVRDYDADLPRIEAYAGELNQVWTNLIDNAVDAMDGRARCASRPAPRATPSSWRSPTPDPACPPRSPPARSSRSSPPRTSARAPASASTSPAASSWRTTRATSPSCARATRPSSASASPRVESRLRYRRVAPPVPPSRASGTAESRLRYRRVARPGTTEHVREPQLARTGRRNSHVPGAQLDSTGKAGAAHLQRL